MSPDEILIAAPEEGSVDVLIRLMRGIHNAGNEDVMAPGEWCVADGEKWPCQTMRLLAVWTQNANYRRRWIVGLDQASTFEEPA